VLAGLSSIGPEFATRLVGEVFYRSFDNRRQLASFAGIAPSPWSSGSIARDQGISKSGSSMVRTTMIELALMWVRYPAVPSAFGSVSASASRRGGCAASPRGARPQAPGGAMALSRGWSGSDWRRVQGALNQPLQHEGDQT
jgi:transposase